MSGVLTSKVQRSLARIPLGPGRECVLCERKIGRFLPHRGGSRSAPPLMKALDMVGSDLDQFSCPACGCNDRERHLFFYLRESGLLAGLRGKSLLQFAPEPMLTPRIVLAGPARHVRGDLFPSAPGVERIDMLAISHPDGTFDFVMANHVLEHVDDDARALAELRRVLRPGGLAVLQTPFSNVLEHTIADAGVRSADARRQLYGQEDHARLYGRDIFARFAAAGFLSRVASHDQALPGIDPVRFGLNRHEPFFLFERT